jgi:poly-gamma-glutamate synthesis protein (capsule biosynthesis protein)
MGLCRPPEPCLDRSHEISTLGERMKRGKIIGASIVAAIGLASRGAALAQDNSILVTLTGQSMIRSDIRATSPNSVATIKSLIKGDVKFTNFEAAVAEKTQSTDKGTGFLPPPEAMDALMAFGINLISTSNNHAFDLGLTGVQNTLKEADARKLVHAGTGNTMAEASAPAYLKTPKGTVALIAQASGLITPDARAKDDGPGVNEMRVQTSTGQQNESTTEFLDGTKNMADKEDSARILKSIREAKAKADLVIVYQHNHVFANRPFGRVYAEQLPDRLHPNEWLVKWTHEEIDAGADIIVMHGAPVLHGIEIYHGKPIFYDLGNFIYNLPPTMTTLDEPINWESAVAYVQFSGKKLQSVTIQPIALNNVGKGQPEIHDPRANNQFIDTRGLPSPAKDIQATDILKRVAEASKPFGTRMTIKDGTGTIALAGK